ncbi:response regulator transcription factor [Paenibacillus sp. MMS20-IR301]|uniref:response regulator transcription factor n=1 Tax=Paenibacillus sp. MMS20-IR301 TaxID=2895946 RepID=UPI0028EEE97D|nr:response regulator transcription factor [Paenibacillus sp. MMS20-IR301]WNS42957.1 response regulator transcription factor [Paenibacillus sp. MMS20-IR301]
MIKVLIVDDEPKLREGMRTLIPWEEQGYTVVGTAANGYEALDKFRQLSPGLVMADIRMPGMDGLELISELRKESPNCHVLILSGYADFEYAKRAIAYHIDGYLLKPVDEDELITYLQELREKISLEERISEWQAAEPARNSEVLIRELLQMKDGSAAPGELAAELGLEGSCEVVLLELKGLNKGEDIREEQVRLLMEQHWAEEEDRGLFFMLPPYMGVMLKAPLKDDAARDSLWLELQHVVTKEGLAFQAAAGGAAVRPEEAFWSFNTARARLDDAFFGQENTLLSGKQDHWNEPLRSPVQQEEEPDPERDVEVQLLLAVEAGSGEVARGLTQQIVRQLVLTRREETYIKDNLMRIVSSTIARLEAANPDARALIARLASPMGEVYSSGNLHDVERLVAAYMEQISGLMGSSGRGDEIKRITDLIQRRYNENLKLGSLSEIFNYNSAYLGKMFKNQVGEHFNTYLDKVRIEKAKQLLTQGMKVYEVAERVGYMNSDYFNAKFRKYVGVSPSAFRKEN